MEESQHNVASSVTNVSRADESLDSIMQSVHVINDMSMQIASATEEQTTVAEEIKRNVFTISQSTVDTVQTTKELSTSSVDFANLAEQMDGLVRQFKV